MLHLRLISPVHRTEAVLSSLDGSAGLTNVVVLRGAARRPAGDVVLCDVAREAADHVVDEPCALGLKDEGSIAIEDVDTSLSRVAVQAQLEVPGEGIDAVVWDQVEERTGEESTL